MEALRNLLKEKVFDISKDLILDEFDKAIEAEFLSKNKIDSLKVPLKNLHSRIKPGSELLGEAKRAKRLDGNTCYILGCGLGYGINSLAQDHFFDGFEKVIVVSSNINSVILSADMLMRIEDLFPLEKLFFIVKLPALKVLFENPAALILAPSLYQRAEGDFLRLVKVKIAFSKENYGLDLETSERKFALAQRFYTASFNSITKEML